MNQVSDVRLLVLDDDPAMGETISLMAKRASVDCRFTAHPAAFFAELERWQPTHIALDLAMPELDGIETLRCLEEIGCRAAIILVSGMGGRVLEAAYRAAASRDLNVVGTIAKPFSMAVLAEFLIRAPGAATIAAPDAPQAEVDISRAMLAAAMDAGDISVAFQPKVSCADGALVGFEALARWHHPEHGNIPPHRFIALAEQNGLCDRLTWTVFDQALAWFRIQHSEGGLTLALNLSAITLGNDGFADELADLCSKHGVRTDAIIIEVTESSAIYDQTAALDLLVRLRLKGFGLSIDDFGVGYSSLSQLARLPFSELKIDHSFVMAILHSEQSRGIVRAVVALAKSLGLGTVAEGVEDLATFSLLKEIGCDQVQGFFVGRPMDSAGVSGWIDSDD